MFPTHRWRPITSGVLVAVTALGSWGCCTMRCEETAEVVVVSPTGEVSKEPVAISKERRQEILWRLSADSTITSVAIALGGNPPPFERCATAEGTCRIPCESGACASGPINPSLSPPRGGIAYAYAFERPEGATADPTIRIDP